MFKNTEHARSQQSVVAWNVSFVAVVVVVVLFSHCLTRQTCQTSGAMRARRVCACA